MSQDRFDGIRLVLRHRRGLVALLTALPVIGGLWAGWRTGAGDFVLAGVLLAPLVWLIARAWLELLDVVSETLFPR